MKQRPMARQAAETDRSASIDRVSATERSASERSGAERSASALASSPVEPDSPGSSAPTVADNLNGPTTVAMQPRLRNPANTDWKAVEILAVELAALAGAEITAALSRSLMVRYKGAPGTDRDPVSEVDRNVESLIRTRLSARFPAHTVIGEEFDAEPDPARDVVWAIDPVDGTNNFINGFPWFSAAIGVMYQGRPMVGAIWCATSHVLRPGVYHARVGGKLCFDGLPVKIAPNPTVRRRLAGFPGDGWRNTPWDKRKTGSTAMECALVAAGSLRLARFDSPYVWDVAGGVALAIAAGREVRVRERHGWVPFESFAGERRVSLNVVARDWRKSLLIGDVDLIDQACQLT